MLAAAALTLRLRAALAGRSGHRLPRPRRGVVPRRGRGAESKHPACAASTSEKETEKRKWEVKPIMSAKRPKNGDQGRTFESWWRAHHSAMARSKPSAKACASFQMGLRGWLYLAKHATRKATREETRGAREAKGAREGRRVTRVTSWKCHGRR